MNGENLLILANKCRKYLMNILNDTLDPSTLSAKITEVLPKMHGWCTPEKAFDLVNIILEQKPSMIVEIGVFGGRSIIPMALACKLIDHGVCIGIDPWEKEPCLEGVNSAENDAWWSALNLEDIYNSYIGWKNVCQIEDKYLQTLRMTSQKAYEHMALLTDPIGLLHVDGAHSEVSSTRDVKLWLPHVRPGGIVVMDDVLWPTTQNAVSLIEKECKLLFDRKEYKVYKKNN